MDTGYSSQFGCPSVVLTDHTVNGEDIIAYAKEVGAIFHDGEDECVVLDDRLDRGVGPELYTFGAARRSFKGA